MENLTHSLLGAVLAELALPHEASSTTRRLFVGAGLVAANAPDLDLLYVGVTPFPLGYLLHHRGHTHTIGGLLAQGLLLVGLCLLVPALRRLARADQVRLWLLIAAGLASHVLMDAMNTYGVHPFHPIDPRWYFGDALFIFEPALWLLLGAAVAARVQRQRVRLLLVVFLTLVPVLLSVTGLIPVESLVVLAVVTAAFVWGTRRATPRMRAGAALAATAVYVIAMVGASAAAEAATRAQLASERRGDIVDVALSPNPAAPHCWSVIAIEKDERAGEFALHRGTLSLAPSWRSPAQCPTHRVTKLRESRWSGDRRLVWSDEFREPLAAFRARRAQDCWVAAWLQFGRAPLIRDGRIVDLRFENGGGENFSAMRLAQQVGRCPTNVTSWGMPRADLLHAPPAASASPRVATH